MMKLIKYPSKEQWAELLKRPALNTESLFDTVPVSYTHLTLPTKLEV